MSVPSISNSSIPSISPISPRAHNAASSSNARANVPARGDKGKEKEGIFEERKKIQGVNGAPVEGVTSPGELTVFVDKLLTNLEAKFDEMSADVLDRMSQMSDRIDNLESSIQEIINDPIDAHTPHRGIDSHRQVGNVSGGEDDQSLLLVDQPHDISLVEEADSS